ncbi:amidohydrolase family protein [Chloroflexota bacterium]
MGKWLIDSHVHLCGGASKSSMDLTDRIKTRMDTFRLYSRYPELYQARLSEEPIDLTDAYIEDMDRHGISHAIIQQDIGKPTKDPVAAVVKKHPDRFFGLVDFLGWETEPIDRSPSNPPSEKEMASYRARAAEEVIRGVEQYGLIGVGEFFARRFTREVHPENIVKDFKPLFDVLAKYKIPIQFMTGWTQFPHNLIYGNPLWIDEIAYSYPEVPIILTKMGRGTHYFDIALFVALRNVNVYFDIVDTLPEHIRKAVDTIGAERIMFGTDWCCTVRFVTEPEDNITKHKKLLDNAKLSSSEREQIEWKTAAEVFRLNL